MGLLRTLILMLIIGVAFNALAARVNTEQGTVVRKTADLPLEWKRYLDTQTDEFWTEGNHKPDAGFLIFAKNPTLQNAKHWLLRNELKAQRLQQMLPLVMQAQIDLVRGGFMEDRCGMVAGRKGHDSKGEKDNSVLSRIKYFFTGRGGQGKEAQLLNTSSSNQQMNALLLSIDYFFLFSPNCPHCKRFAENLRGISNVVPLQMDSGPLHNWMGLAPSTYASSETVNKYAPDGRVPVLVIYDRNSRQAQVLRGVQTTESVLLASAKLISMGRGKK